MHAPPSAPHFPGLVRKSPGLWGAALFNSMPAFLNRDSTLRECAFMQPPRRIAGTVECSRSQTAPCQRFVYRASSPARTVSVAGKVNWQASPELMSS